MKLSSRLSATAVVSLVVLAGCSDDEGTKASADEPVATTSAAAPTNGADPDLTEADRGTLERTDGVVPIIDGEFGAAPTVKVPGAEAADGSSGTTITGTGTEVAGSDRLVAHLGVYDLVSGEVLANSWIDEAPLLFVLDAKEAPPALLEGLAGVTVGSRYWTVASAQQATVAGAAVADPAQRVLMVVDVLDAFPVDATVDGTLQAAPDGYPQVTGAAGSKPTVSKATAAAPTEATRAPIVMGTGPMISSGAQTVLQYVMVDWATGEEVDSSWESNGGPMFYIAGSRKLPTPVAEQLVGVTEGSRVMVVLPPIAEGQLAAGLDPTKTYVVLVDVLSVMGTALSGAAG